MKTKKKPEPEELGFNTFIGLNRIDFECGDIVGFKRSAGGWLSWCDKRQMWLLEFVFEQWQPTRKPEQALRVLQALADRMEAGDALLITGKRLSNKYSLGVFDRPGSWVDCDTFPRAICEFAVKAQADGRLKPIKR